MNLTRLKWPKRRHDDERPSGDRGITLIEIVITITLLGVVIVPILAAVATSIRSSRVSEDAAQVETLLVNAVDRVNRATRDDFPCDLTKPVEAAIETVGWPVTSVRVDHAYLDVNENWVTESTACPGGSFRNGIVQRITITITSPDEGLTRSLQVIRGDI